VTEIDLTDQFRARVEKRIRKILKINKYLLYNQNKEYGPIGAWIMTSKKAIPSAKKLIIEKNTAIYIHRQYGSAVFTWDYIEQEFVMQIWFQQKMVEHKVTKNINEFEQMMIEAWNYCTSRKPTHK